MFYFIIYSYSECLLTWREKGPACHDGKVASNSDQAGTANYLKEHPSFSFNFQLINNTHKNKYYS